VPTPQELHIVSKKQMQLQQPRVILPATSRKASATNQQAMSGRKPPQLQQLLSSTSNATNHVETAFLP
jgi:hypothetical protein